MAVDAKKPSDQNWQKKCEAITDQIKKAQGLAAELTSLAAMGKAQGAIEKKSDDLRFCRNNQYYTYQIWVIERCDEAFKSYSGYRAGLSVDDARKVFRESGLVKVDQALLSPEVSRIFNDVLGKLTIEMGPETLVRTEREMGTLPKKKLEEF